MDVRWLNGKSMLLAPVVYLIIIGPSLFYQKTDYVPANLSRSSGVILFEKSGKKYNTVLKSNNDVEVFSCAEGFGQKSDCIPRKDISIYKGKSATVSWYEKKVYFGVYIKKIVELKIDGVTLIDRDMVVGRMIAANSLSSYVFSAVFILILVISLFIIKKQEGNK